MVSKQKCSCDLSPTGLSIVLKKYTSIHTTELWLCCLLRFFLLIIPVNIHILINLTCTAQSFSFSLASWLTLQTIAVLPFVTLVNSLTDSPSLFQGYTVLSFQSSCLYAPNKPCSGVRRALWRSIWLQLLNKLSATLLNYMIWCTLQPFSLAHTSTSVSPSSLHEYNFWFMKQREYDPTSVNTKPSQMQLPFPPFGLAMQKWNTRGREWDRSIQHSLNRYAVNKQL